jgi:hypothetical protein
MTSFGKRLESPRKYSLEELRVCDEEVLLNKEESSEYVLGKVKELALLSVLLVLDATEALADLVEEATERKVLGLVEVEGAEVLGLVVHLVAGLVVHLVVLGAEKVVEVL